MWLKDYLIEYSNDVINGDVVACVKHKQACQRFLYDIKREGTDDFPYIFDEDKGEKFLEWMTLFKHTKGKFQNEYIEPHEIQIFVFGNIYGWVHKDSGYRRFNKGYWQVARKNAKSQSLACVASYEAFALGENMSEVYIGATKSEQSKIVYNETLAQIKACDFLKGKWKDAYGKITHLKSDSYITALSKDANKTGDGFNPQTAIIDEYHAHKTSEILDVLDSGMGARPQPLTMIITTAGFELANPCFRVEYKYISQILDPETPIDNENYFIMVNELDKNDDIKDESVWEKANPIICSYEEGIEKVRKDFKEAQDAPEKMRNFLTKRMNIWVDMKENGYMDMKKWSRCGGEINLEDLRGKQCTVGVDLSAKHDLTSIFFEFRTSEGYTVLSHSFMPEDTVAQKARTDKVPYQMWVDQGWITETPGAVVDYSFIKAYIKRMETEYGFVIKEICADPWNATQFMQDMEYEGYTVIEIRQGIQTLGGPTKDFREEVYRGRVRHNNNPVLTWAIGNAVTRQDHNENIMLDKSKVTERIDPIAAGLNAHVRGMLLEQDLNEHFLNNWSM